jgi:dihydropteroate synthase
MKLIAKDFGAEHTWMEGSRMVKEQSTLIKAGQYTLDYGNKTLIMGILNVTPDSFSDGGKYSNVENAVQYARQMIEDGADILDIGGESTRPGYEPISDEEEISRVLPSIEAITKELHIPISIDTYKSEVAKKAVDAGAVIINDIWGAKADPEIADVAAETGVPIILMHNRNERNYTNFIRDVLNDLYESITIAKKAGVKDDQIILDPGIGFAKDLTENLEMMRHLDTLVSLGYPVLLGTSKKSMIGGVLDLPVSERTEGTGATVCFGIQQGCQIVRIHDVKEMSRTAKMMDALMGKGDFSG